MCAVLRTVLRCTAKRLLRLPIRYARDNNITSSYRVVIVCIHYYVVCDDYTSVKRIHCTRVYPIAQVYRLGHDYDESYEIYNNIPIPLN